MTKIKAAFNFLFGTMKGRAYSDGFCTLLWIFVAATTESSLVAGLSAMNAAIFGVGVGTNISRHFTDQLVESLNRTVDIQDEVIEELHNLVELGKSS